MKTRFMVAVIHNLSNCDILITQFKCDFFKQNSKRDHLPARFTAQIIEHCNSITEVGVSNPVQA